MNDRERWEERHRASPERAAPSPFVARHVAAIASTAPGKLALDVACGSGRHVLLLRQYGFRAVAVDRANAACQRVAVEIAGAQVVAADASALPFRAASFTLIVQTQFLERLRLPDLLRLLVPRGVLLLETFLLAQYEATGHPRREFCLLPGELPQLCTAAGVAVEVLETREGIVPTNTGVAHLASIAVCKV